MKDSNEQSSRDAKKIVEAQLDVTKQQATEKPKVTIEDKINIFRQEIGPEHHIPRRPLKKLARAERTLDRQRKLNILMDHLPHQGSFEDAFHDILGEEIPKSLDEAERNYDNALRKVDQQQRPLSTKIITEMADAVITRVETMADEEVFREALKSLSPSETVDTLGRLEEQTGLYQQKTTEVEQMQETSQRLRSFVRNHRRRGTAFDSLNMPEAARDES